MPVRHVAAAGMSAAICPCFGLVVVRRGRLFPFKSLVNIRLNFRSEDRQALEDLPWDGLQCWDMFYLRDGCLDIGLQDAQQGLVYLRFEAGETRREEVQTGLDLLQSCVRRKVLQDVFQKELKILRQQKLEALGLGLHRRLGEDYPMIEDVLYTVATNSFP